MPLPRPHSIHTGRLILGTPFEIPPDQAPVECCRVFCRSTNLCRMIRLRWLVFFMTPVMEELRTGAWSAVQYWPTMRMHHPITEEIVFLYGVIDIVASLNNMARDPDLYDD